MNRTSKYVALARREFWEHRSLWMWPVAISVLLIVAATLVSVFAHGKLEVHGRWGQGTVDLPHGVTATDVGVFGLATQILGISAIVCFFYLVDCLYAERKDRSILFWKSLPVSDTATVLTKFAVALLLVPLLAYLLTSVAYPIIYAVAGFNIPEFAQLAGGWRSVAWLRAEGALLGALLASVLWYAPIAAWAMLASVIAKRAPIMFAIVPVVALGICESLLLQTGHVWSYVGRRLQPLPDVASAVQRLDFWLGLAAAAALIIAVIRLRRYRDDT